MSLRRGPFGVKRWAASAPPGELVAGAHFVNASTASTNWSAATDISTPCTPATAFANAAAGDTVYFRGGTYSVGQTTGDTPSYSPFMPTNSGSVGSPITFIAYPGETPILDGDVGATNSCIVIGAVGVDYITIDGFTCQAAGGVRVPTVYLFHTYGCELKNLTVNGGSSVPTYNDNLDGIRIDESGLTLVSHCVVRDIREVDGNGNDAHNAAGIKMYHNNAYWQTGGGFITVEHCQIYNCSAGIYVKSSTDDCTIRYSVLSGNMQGIYVTPQGTATQYSSDRGSVHHNLVVNPMSAHALECSGFGSDSQSTTTTGNDWDVYNNTFHMVQNMLTGNGIIGISQCESGHGWDIYNNVAYSDSSISFFNQAAAGVLATEDHNQWGPTPSAFGWGYGDIHTFAEWQASAHLEGGGAPGSGDLASDPKFSNGSGTFSLVSDYALANDSPCKGTGRSGADMGCDVTQLTGTLSGVTPPVGANGFIDTTPTGRYGDGAIDMPDTYAFAQRFVVPGTGTIEIGELGLYTYNGAASGNLCKLAIFEDDSANGCPGAMVTNSETDALAIPYPSIVKSSHTYTGTKPQVTGGSAYWIGSIQNNDNQCSRFATGGTGLYLDGSAPNYPTWPSESAWHTHTDMARDLSFFAVYV
jgi:hypothetical protein